MDLKSYITDFRVKSALKVAFAAVICTLINNILHLDAIYLAELYTFLILSLFHGQALKVGVQALITAIIFGTISLLITYLFSESKIVYLILMSLVLFLCMTFIKKYFLATLLTGVLVAITTYMAVNESVTEATDTAQNFVIQMFLAVIVCWIVDDYIWPHRSRKSFDMTLKSVFSELGGLYGTYASAGGGSAVNHRSISTTLVTFSGLMTLLNRVSNEEPGGEHFPSSVYIKIITFTRGIYVKTEVLEEYILKKHKFLENTEVKGELSDILEDISERLNELSEAISEQKELNPRADSAASTMDSLHESYRKMHEVKGEDDQYYEDLLAMGAMLPVLEEILEKLSKIEEFYNIIVRKQYQSMLKLRMTHADKVEEIKSKSFSQFNEETIKIGVRTVVIFWLLLLGQALIYLPGGALVSFYAILFGIIPNLGQAFMKSWYGIAGILGGIAWGLVALIIISVTPHLILLLLLFVIGFFISSFLSTSPRDIAASGLQAGLVIPYAMLYTTGPQVDLDAAITRFLALLSAVFISLIVLNVLWPVNPYTQLKHNISKALRVSGSILNKLLALDSRDKDKIDSMVVPLAASLPTSSALLHDAEYVIRSDELYSDEYIHIIESLETIFVDLETLKRMVYENMDSELFHLYLSHMSEDYLKLYGYFERVSELFGSEKSDFTHDISELKNQIEQHRREFRDSDQWRRFDPKDVEMNVLVATSIDNLLESLYKISSRMNIINGTSSQKETTLQPSET